MSAPRKSTCYECTNDCLVEAEVDERGRVTHLSGPACERHAAQLGAQYHPDRLLHPMRRVGPRGAGKWERISWDTALDEIVAALGTAKSARGAESAAFVVGYTKEPRPYLQRLAHAFGSPNYMTESSCCFSAGYVAAEVTLGKDFGFFLMGGRADSQATRCLLAWSTNPFESLIPYAQHHFSKPRAGRSLVVVDPRRTPLAELADVHLQIRPGTDGALALAMAHVLFAEGLHDGAFLDRWASGVDAYREYVKAFAPERVAGICGVPADRIVAAARLYGTNRPGQIAISPNATTHHANGFQAHRAVLLLAALTGNLDVDGGNRRHVKGPSPKPIDLFKQSIGRLPPRIGSERFPVWSAHYPEAQAMLLPDAILDGRPYPVRALLGVGMNSMMWPETPRFERALAALDFFACVDFFPTPATRLADVVLPAATALERPALITRGNGTILYRQPAVAPEGEARPDTQILLDLGCRLGMADRFWNGDFEASVRERLADVPGVTLDALRAAPEGIRPPTPPLPERAYENRGFRTPSGKIEFDSTELRAAGLPGLPVWSEPAESPASAPATAARFPLVLTSGGRSRHFTHSRHRNIPALRQKEPLPRLQINPADAAARGLRDGDPVLVSSARGSLDGFRAWLTDAVAPGVVHAFHGWAEANVNVLTCADHLDPISGFPSFKASLCEVGTVRPR